MKEWLLSLKKNRASRKQTPVVAKFLYPFKGFHDDAMLVESLVSTGMDHSHTSLFNRMQEVARKSAKGQVGKR